MLDIGARSIEQIHSSAQFIQVKQQLNTIFEK